MYSSVLENLFIIFSPMLSDLESGDFSISCIVN